MQHYYLTFKRKIKIKKKKKTNKLGFLKAKSEITFKPFARQKEMEVGKETEMRTREH